MDSKIDEEIKTSSSEIDINKISNFFTIMIESKLKGIIENFLNNQIKKKYLIFIKWRSNFFINILNLF